MVVFGPVREAIANTRHWTRILPCRTNAEFTPNIDETGMDHLLRTASRTSIIVCKRWLNSLKLGEVCIGSESFSDRRLPSMTDQQLQVFLEYTRRFDAMTVDLPMFIRLNNQEGINQSPEPDFLHSFMLRYLNLSCEEWFLHSKGLITNEVWELWKHHIETTLKDSNLFGEFWWTKCRGNFIDPDAVSNGFAEMVDRMVPPRSNYPKSKMVNDVTINSTKGN